MHTCRGPLSDVDALLLDIYSQIDEPDGMYAAARTQQAASQLALFEHEGAWDKALVSCDLMLPQRSGHAFTCKHLLCMPLPMPAPETLAWSACSCLDGHLNRQGGGLLSREMQLQRAS